MRRVIRLFGQMHLHGGMGAQKELSGILNVPAAGQIKQSLSSSSSRPGKSYCGFLQGGMQSMGQCDLMRGSPCALTPEREDVNI